MSRVCSHLPRLYEVSAVFQWNVRLHLQRVASHVDDQLNAVDGRVLVEEKHEVDDAGERTQRVILVRSAFPAARFQVTCNLKLTRDSS